jgi:hypothetical protein
MARMIADGFLQEGAEGAESYHRSDLFGVLQKETKVTKTNFRRILRASFSWLPSVQYSESDQRLAAEFNSPLPLRPSVKSDSGVGRGSPSAFIRVIRGKIIHSAYFAPCKTKSGF